MRARLGLKSGFVGCDGGIGAKGAGLDCGSGDVHGAVHGMGGMGVKCGPGPGRPGPKGGLVGSTAPNVAVESESVGGGSVVIGSRDVIGSRAGSLARAQQLSERLLLLLSPASVAALGRSRLNWCGWARRGKRRRELRGCLGTWIQSKQRLCRVCLSLRTPQMQPHGIWANATHPFTCHDMLSSGSHDAEMPAAGTCSLLNS